MKCMNLLYPFRHGRLVWNQTKSLTGLVTLVQQESPGAESEHCICRACSCKQRTSSRASRAIDLDSIVKSAVQVKVHTMQAWPDFKAQACVNFVSHTLRLAKREISVSFLNMLRQTADVPSGPTRSMNPLRCLSLKMRSCFSWAGSFASSNRTSRP